MEHNKNAKKKVQNKIDTVNNDDDIKVVYVGSKCLSSLSMKLALNRKKISSPEKDNTAHAENESKVEVKNDTFAENELQFVMEDIPKISEEVSDLNLEKNKNKGTIEIDPTKCKKQDKISKPIVMSTPEKILEKKTNLTLHSFQRKSAIKQITEQADKCIMDAPRQTRNNQKSKIKVSNDNSNRTVMSPKASANTSTVLENCNVIEKTQQYNLATNGNRGMTFFATNYAFKNKHYTIDEGFMIDIGHVRTEDDGIQNKNSTIESVPENQYCFNTPIQSCSTSTQDTNPNVNDLDQNNQINKVLDVFAKRGDPCVQELENLSISSDNYNEEISKTNDNEKSENSSCVLNTNKKKQLHRRGRNRVSDVTVRCPVEDCKQTFTKKWHLKKHIITKPHYFNSTRKFLQVYESIQSPFVEYCASCNWYGRRLSRHENISAKHKIKVKHFNNEDESICIANVDSSPTRNISIPTRRNLRPRTLNSKKNYREISLSDSSPTISPTNISINTIRTTTHNTTQNVQSTLLEKDKDNVSINLPHTTLSFNTSSSVDAQTNTNLTSVKSIYTSCQNKDQGDGFSIQWSKYKHLFRPRRKASQINAVPSRKHYDQYLVDLSSENNYESDKDDVDSDYIPDTQNNDRYNVSTSSDDSDGVAEVNDVSQDDGFFLDDCCYECSNDNRCNILTENEITSIIGVFENKVLNIDEEKTTNEFRQFFLERMNKPITIDYIGYYNNNIFNASTNNMLQDNDLSINQDNDENDSFDDEVKKFQEQGTAGLYYNALRRTEIKMKLFRPWWSLRACLDIHIWGKYKDSNGCCVSPTIRYQDIKEIVSESKCGPSRHIVNAYKELLRYQLEILTMDHKPKITEGLGYELVSRTIAKDLKEDIHDQIALLNPLYKKLNKLKNLIVKENKTRKGSSRGEKLQLTKLEEIITVFFKSETTKSLITTLKTSEESLSILLDEEKKKFNSKLHNDGKEFDPSRNKVIKNVATFLRNVLVFTLMSRISGHRGDVMRWMTVGDLFNAVSDIIKVEVIGPNNEITQVECHNIQVAHHKMGTIEPAYVVVPKIILQLMMLYYRHWRALFVDPVKNAEDTDEPLFIAHKPLKINKVSASSSTLYSLKQIGRQGGKPLNKLLLPITTLIHAIISLEYPQLIEGNNYHFHVHQLRTLFSDWVRSTEGPLGEKFKKNIHSLLAQCYGTSQDYYQNKDKKAALCAIATFARAKALNLPGPLDEEDIEDIFDERIEKRINAQNKRNVNFERFRERLDRMQRKPTKMHLLSGPEKAWFDDWIDTNVPPYGREAKFNSYKKDRKLSLTKGIILEAAESNKIFKEIFNRACDRKKNSKQVNNKYTENDLNRIIKGRNCKNHYYLESLVCRALRMSYRATLLQRILNF